MLPIDPMSPLIDKIVAIDKCEKIIFAILNFYLKKRLFCNETEDTNRDPLSENRCEKGQWCSFTKIMSLVGRTNARSISFNRVKLIRTKTFYLHFR